MRQGTRLTFYRLLLRRLSRFLAAYVSLIVAAGVGFYLIETPNYDLLTSMYWAVVTIATVGYGDVVPHNDLGKEFTIGVILIAVFLTAYLISIIISVVGDEQEKRSLGMLGTDFVGHVIVLGYTGVGRTAVRELLAAGEKVAVVTADANEVPSLRTLAPENRLFVTYYAAGDPQLLDRLNVGAAQAVVICTDDDTTNLVTALTTRQSAPSVRLVVAIGRSELRPTLRSAGVTYVATPNETSGRLLANAAYRPDVVRALEGLASSEYGVDIGEYVLHERSPISTQTFEEADALVRAHCRGILIGYARPRATGEYGTVLNPPSTFRFQPGDALLVLGTLDNLRQLEAWLGIVQGR